MHARCGNPNNDAYPNYGGRGITVCDRWFNFWLFIEDMGERPDNYTIERKDNDKGYSPDNCVWATRLEQRANCRERETYWKNTSDPMRYITKTKHGTYSVYMGLGDGRRIQRCFKTLDEALEFRSDIEMEREMHALLK